MARQRQRAKGFEKIGIGTDRPAQLLIGDLAAGGQQHDMDTGKLGIALQALAKLKTVHAARHQYVEHDRIGAPMLDANVSRIGVTGLLKNKEFT
jgi:hypothetical protein